MPVVNDLPDLSHWYTVQEFSITEAALLLTGIDPLDCPTLEQAKDTNHKRWKMAYGFANGMVTAIRRGILTPVECFTKIEDFDGFGNFYTEYKSIFTTDRTHEINRDKTIITRHSLREWIKNERVDFVRDSRPIPVKEVNPPAIIESSHQVINPDEYLRTYGHKSDGLEYVQDAIRELWSTYDPDDPQTAPTEHEVLEYLKKRGAGSNVARAVNLILRPEHLKRIGRRPKKTKS